MSLKNKNKTGIKRFDNLPNHIGYHNVDEYRKAYVSRKKEFEIVKKALEGLIKIHKGSDIMSSVKFRVKNKGMYDNLDH